MQLKSLNPANKQNILKFLSKSLSKPISEISLNKTRNNGACSWSYKVTTSSDTFFLKVLRQEVSTSVVQSVSLRRIENECNGAQFAFSALGNPLFPIACCKDSAMVLYRWVPSEFGNVQHMIDASKSAVDCIYNELFIFLANWRKSSAGIDPPKTSKAAFKQLRIEAFFDQAAQKFPEYAQKIHRLSNRLLNGERVFTHGDFSPKNIVLDSVQKKYCVVDFELCHSGLPEYDTAGLTHHYAIDCVTQGIERSLEEVLYTIKKPNSATSGLDEEFLHNLVGILLMGRIYGKARFNFEKRNQKRLLEEVARHLI